jgi:hypothetical protein
MDGSLSSGSTVVGIVEVGWNDFVGDMGWAADR